jgi:hypothetical protein
LKGLPGTNTILLGPFMSYEKMKCCDCSPYDSIHNIS